VFYTTLVHGQDVKIGYWRAGSSLFAIFYAFDMVAHSLFAMRYWILSYKIESFKLRRVDHLFVCKNRLFYAVLMGWIAAQAIMEIYFWWKPRPA
jgi:hypothetical protein